MVKLRFHVEDIREWGSCQQPGSRLLAGALHKAALLKRFSFPSGIRGVNHNQSSGLNHSLNSSTIARRSWIPEKTTGLDLPTNKALCCSSTQQICWPSAFMFDICIWAKCQVNHALLRVALSCLLELHNCCLPFFFRLCFASFMHMWVSAGKSVRSHNHFTSSYRLWAKFKYWLILCSSVNCIYTIWSKMMLRYE